MTLAPWMFFVWLGVVALFIGGIVFFLFTLSKKGQRLF